MNHGHYKRIDYATNTMLEEFRTWTIPHKGEKRHLKKLSNRKVRHEGRREVRNET